MDSSSPCQNRRSRRSQVLLAATLEVAGVGRAIKLRNLSAEGALVEGGDLPAESSQVRFIRNELSVPGRIVWVKGSFAGIAFDEMLQPDQVLRHVPAPRPKIQPKHWRPGFTQRHMTPEQRRLAESWVWSPSTQRPGE